MIVKGNRNANLFPLSNFIIIQLQEQFEENSQWPGPGRAAAPASEPRDWRRGRGAGAGGERSGAGAGSGAERDSRGHKRDASGAPSAVHTKPHALNPTSL